MAAWRSAGAAADEDEASEGEGEKEEEGGGLARVAAALARGSPLVAASPTAAERVETLQAPLTAMHTRDTAIERRLARSSNAAARTACALANAARLALPLDAASLLAHFEVWKRGGGGLGVAAKRAYIDSHTPEALRKVLWSFAQADVAAWAPLVDPSLLVAPAFCDLAAAPALRAAWAFAAVPLAEGGGEGDTMAIDSATDSGFLDARNADANVVPLLVGTAAAPALARALRSGALDVRDAQARRRAIALVADLDSFDPPASAVSDVRCALADAFVLGARAAGQRLTMAWAAWGGGLSPRATRAFLLLLSLAEEAFSMEPVGAARVAHAALAPLIWAAENAPTPAAKGSLAAAALLSLPQHMWVRGGSGAAGIEGTGALAQHLRAARVDAAAAGGECAWFAVAALL